MKNNNTNIIVLNNKMFNIGINIGEIKMNMIEKVKAILPSKNLVKDGAQTVRPQPPKPRTEESQKSFKEILDEVKTTRDEIFISAEGRESFRVNKNDKEGDKINNKECNHDPNSDNSSLKLLPRRVMVQPAQYDMVCQNCNKGFKFIKDVETKRYIKYDDLNS